MSSSNTITLAILFAFVAFVQSKDCAKMCTLEFNQVCASNGKEYRLFDNPCMLDVFNCEQEFSWTLLRSVAPCLADATDISTKKHCETPCTFDLNPVCGFNGEVYQEFDNLCHMNNAHCNDGKIWRQTRSSDCLKQSLVSQEVSDCIVPCDMEYSPICGFDGETYQLFDNICDLNNAHCESKKTWQAASFTACIVLPGASKQVSDCIVPCTMEYVPTCGFNGEKHQIFNNICEMNNAGCVDGTLWKQERMNNCGIPISNEVSKEVSDCIVPCQMDYVPTCGFNGEKHQIFNNICEMNNAGCVDGTLWKQERMNNCGIPISNEVSKEVSDCIVPCQMDYVPTCGFNGEKHQIFSNICEMNNAGCVDGTLWKQERMNNCGIPISNEVSKEVSDCIVPCQMDYVPTCGFNGEKHQIFSNICEMNNAGCVDGTLWKQERMNNCGTPISNEVSKEVSDCIVPCTMEYAPTCGFNGEKHQIFSNICEMNNAGCVDGTLWKQERMYNCGTPVVAATKRCEKPCTREYVPVCGFNGERHQVFSNMCELENGHCMDGKLWKQERMSNCEMPIAAVTKRCEKPCTREYKPVCGFNGERHEIFSNMCVLGNAHCMDGKLWKQERMSNCEIPVAALTKDCEKPCTYEYNPICGSNGERHEIFSNMCGLENAHCMDGKLWKQERMSNCEIPVAALTKDCEKPCTYEYNPVCGSNGERHEIFSNMCGLENAHCMDGKLWKQERMTNCGTPVAATTKRCEKPCTREYVPVCGFNGERHEIFSNMCVLGNAHCMDGKLWKQERMSNCEIPIAAVTKVCEKPCTYEYNPVCGFNGERHQVFPNACSLDNAHCDDGKTWAQTRFAECNEVTKVFVEDKNNCEKPCTKNLKPVCGFDGQHHKLFDNQCIMDNEHCKDGHLWKSEMMSSCLFRGPLALKSNDKINCEKPCTRNYAPVCGSDGEHFKVFNNLCLMENEHCKDGHKWQETTFSMCSANGAAVVKPKKNCIKICPAIYLPTCGFDGQTYHSFDNQCQMEVFNCENDSHFMISTLSNCNM